MLRVFKSWRSIRWLVFASSLGIDLYAFYRATPFTPLSFAASGTLAVIFFLVFIEIGLLMRGQGRIRSSLGPGEHIRYQVGRHLAELLERIGGRGFDKWAVWLPVWFALGTGAFLAWSAWHLYLAPSPFTNLTTIMQYACAGFLPLLIASPVVLEHVSEWTSWQHVVISDEELGDPQLLISHGVLDYDLEILSLERTVTTHVRQSLWDSLIAIGDVELRETAGGEGEKLERVWRPRKLAKQIRAAIGNWRHGHGAPSD